MNYDNEYRKRQLKIIRDINNLYDEIVDALISTIVAARIVEKEYFQFKNHKATSTKIDSLIKNLSVNLDSYIKTQSTSVWELSNIKNDALVDKIYQPRKISPSISLKQTNPLELNKLLSRKVKGLTISDRVWNLNGSYKQEIESAINAALEKGQSAESLARDIKKYLNNPDARYRRVRDKFGKLVPSKEALQYRPGQGVYRSAKQNALRLTRNEINNAYRLADWERWQQLPFITGFKIQNSTRIATVCPICKRFDGKVFPKTFKFLGFHVSCMCTALPVMAKEPELSKIISGQSVELDYPPMPEEYLNL